ncbi:MAG: hypothetical protein D6692_09055 [Planctomycetota bacterium]|nr:MAG: hypothetical protein D6692_09055 [Planctomycetota bacterium]
MADQPERAKPKSGMEALELAALRNAPLSVGRPESIGKEPMARARFLVPKDGVLVLENLQVPGRSVDLAVDTVLEAYFQANGDLYTFRTRVLEMDTPVQLNDTLVVKGMKVAAPKSVEKGNRRRIYRQSFAVAESPVDAEVWAVPEHLLTTEQMAALIREGSERPETRPEDESGERWGFEPESGEVPKPVANVAPTPRNIVRTAIPGLTLAQLRSLMDGMPNWRGEIADASEFGIGLSVLRVVYSRLKIFQPLVVRFTLPDSSRPLEFLMEVRRVQALKNGARLGGLFIIDASQGREVQAARELARFSLQLQRAKAARVRGAV